MLYLIQGFFFEKNSSISLGMSDDGEGVIGVLQNNLCRFMFSGIIHSDNNNAIGGLTGQMSDHFGDSVLSGVRISPKKEMKFIKKYNSKNENNAFRYKFSYKDGLWVGTYSNLYDQFNKGRAKCIISEVSEKLLCP